MMRYSGLHDEQAVVHIVRSGDDNLSVAVHEGTETTIVVAELAHQPPFPARVSLFVHLVPRLTRQSVIFLVVATHLYIEAKCKSDAGMWRCHVSIDETNHLQHGFKLGSTCPIPPLWCPPIPPLRCRRRHLLPRNFQFAKGPSSSARGGGEGCRTPARSPGIHVRR